MKYTIIGSISGYVINDIKPFVLSIHNSGYDGQKIMIFYDKDPEIDSFLRDFGWNIYYKTINKPSVIYNQRLVDSFEVLKNQDTDIVIFLDVFDIVFNKNPVEWISKNFYGDLIATSESLNFKNDDWSTFIGSFFPDEWEWLKDKEIYNCGVIIGKKNIVMDLLNTMYNMGVSINKENYPFDQITFNIEIHKTKYNTQFVNQQQGFVCHLTLKDKYSEPYYFTEKLPIIRNSKVFNNDNEEFYIIHQYKKINNFKLLY